VVANDAQEIVPRPGTVSDAHVATMDPAQKYDFIHSTVAKPEHRGAAHPIDDSGVRDVGAKVPDLEGGLTLEQETTEYPRCDRWPQFVEVFISIDNFTEDHIDRLILFDRGQHRSKATLRPDIVTVDKCQKST
jgi:hypothetical protein